MLPRRGRGRGSAARTAPAAPPHRAQSAPPGGAAAVTPGDALVTGGDADVVAGVLVTEIGMFTGGGTADEVPTPASLARSSRRIPRRDATGGLTSTGTRPIRPPTPHEDTRIRSELDACHAVHGCPTIFRSLNGCTLTWELGTKRLETPALRAVQERDGLEPQNPLISDPGNVRAF
jgi:hypothetical protein